MILKLLLTAAGWASGLLNLLKTNGVNTGDVGTEITKIIDESEVDLANYAAGQAVPLVAFSTEGIPGHFYAIADKGPAATLLGL